MPVTAFRTEITASCKACIGLQAYKYEDRFLINPGSATGAYSTITPDSNPSFVLMDINGSKVSFSPKAFSCMWRDFTFTQSLGPWQSEECLAFYSWCCSHVHLASLLPAFCRIATIQLLTAHWSIAWSRVFSCMKQLPHVLISSASKLQFCALCRLQHTFMSSWRMRSRWTR